MSGYQKTGATGGVSVDRGKLHSIVPYNLQPGSIFLPVVLPGWNAKKVYLRILETGTLNTRLGR